MRSIVFGCLEILLLFLIWIAATLWVHHSHKPKPGVKDLAGFLAKMPAPEKSSEFEIDGKKFLRLRGKLPWFAWMTFPSGQPSYVFDQNTKLVDWTPDDGDNDRFQEKWKPSSPSKEIRLDALPNWSKEQK